MIATLTPGVRMGLDIVELVMAIEREFGITIPNADAMRLRTVGDVYWYVRERIAPDDGANDAEPTGDLWTRVLDLVERETGLPRDRLRPDAAFVEDLGLD